MSNINLSQLSGPATSALSLSNLLLVSPQGITGYQPQTGPSYQQDTTTPPLGLLFHYNGEEAISLSSDVTDHYIEDNSTIQDQVALKPETITVQGFIGELNNVAPLGLQTIKFMAEKLSAISAYAPQVSATASLAYAEALALYQLGASIGNSAVSSWASINGTGGVSGGQGIINGAGIVSGSAVERLQTQQQIIFQQLYGHWKKRTLFTVQTPWAIFQDMIIMNLKATQSAETKMISDFEITFKLLRFATTLTASTNKLQSDNFQSNGKAGASPEVNNGINNLQTA